MFSFRWLKGGWSAPTKKPQTCCHPTYCKSLLATSKKVKTINNGNIQRFSDFSLRN